MNAGPEPVPATQDAIAAAAAHLRAGRLVAFPTETVYGLGALAGDGQAVARLFQAKGRPRFNPLIVHVADAVAAQRLARWSAAAERVAAAFWPGPVTLVLPRLDGARVSELATAGLDTIALRVPAHPVAQALLAAIGRPVAAPSANRSEALSPTRAEHVAESLGDAVVLILDDGPCPVGIESSVVDLSGPLPVLLRPGGLPRGYLETVLGPLAMPERRGAPRSPGQLTRHYAPRTPLRLDARDVAGDEALLWFGPNAPAGGVARRNLSPVGDLVEAAANLFAALHALDRAAARRIAVGPIPRTGLGEAIDDRLRRAAGIPQNAGN